MFTTPATLDSVLQCLIPAFTQPSFQTHVEVLLGWVMCWGKRTEYGVFQTIRADTPISRKRRHPFDRFYNFFNRSAWTVGGLARQVAVAIVARLNPPGLLYLAVDGAYSAKNLLGELDSRVTYVGVMRSDAVIYDPLPPKQSKSKPGRKAVALGLADAKRNQLVVYYQRPQTAPSACRAAAFRQVGYGMVARTYASGAPRGNPRRYN